MKINLYFGVLEREDASDLNSKLCLSYQNSEGKVNVILSEAFELQKREAGSPGWSPAVCRGHQTILILQPLKEQP